MAQKPKWTAEALQLRCGRTRRIVHCKSDNSMLISHDLKGVSSHCFRCGFHGFIPHGIQRIEDIKRREAEFKASMLTTGLTLPDDYTLDIPLREMTWFTKYGISPELARMYRLGWTDNLQRIVMPVLENGELTALQMRSNNPDIQPKYLNPFGPKISSAVFFSETEPQDIGVVVEDILSSIKVGMYIPSASILGTKMSDARAVKIAKRWKKAILWFDNDKAGWMATKRSAQQLSLQGVQCYRVKSEADPKTYTRAQIKQHLYGAVEWR